MKTLFIVGAAGYVGEMLCDQFSKRDDVKEIIALDKEPIPKFLKSNPKITWIDANTSDQTWQQEVKQKEPEIVIHTAWQIREMYGKKKLQWKWNVDGSNNIFDFAFEAPSVKKIIYFSTAASYGAYVDNTISHKFTEEEGFRDENYLYATEKKIVEENLQSKRKSSKKDTGVVILRPAAITGPRGRHMRTKFSLQSALSGQLRNSFVYRVITLMVSFMPVTKHWCRQFIHEDDVTNIVELFSFNDLKTEYEVFNITPHGSHVSAPEMAKAVGKKMLMLKPWMIRFVFFIFWHITRGNVPTARGSWRFYSYPIVMDGSKITKMYGYKYTATALEAFSSTNGRYEKYISEELRTA